jgi:hypothetical protein
MFFTKVNLVRYTKILCYKTSAKWFGLNKRNEFEFEIQTLQ